MQLCFLDDIYCGHIRMDSHGMVTDIASLPSIPLAKCAKFLCFGEVLRGGKKVTRRLEPGNAHFVLKTHVAVLAGIFCVKELV